jgi:hypothetical protein
LLDDNLLACSEQHQRAVFAMLNEQKALGHRIEFTGGLEAARLHGWQAEELRKLKPKQMFFAYDTEDDLEPLRWAGNLLLLAGFTTTSHCLRAYVLCGYQGDTLKAASKRMAETIDAGFLPMAMLYRGKNGKRDPKWMKWARQYARPAITCSSSFEKKSVSIAV